MLLRNVVFVLGAPGAGKGTQCSKLADKYGYTHISAGELLRAEVKENGPDATLIAKLMSEAKIVPSSITVNLLSRAMDKVSSEGTSRATLIFLIDGFPRTQENWSAWEEIIGDKANVKCMLFYDCPEAVCIDRVLHREDNRPDDTEVIVKKRIQTYTSCTVPIICQFRDSARLRVVDAGNTVEQVFEDTEKLIVFWEN